MAMKKGLKKLYDDSEALESRLFSIPIDKYTSSKQMDEAGKIRIKLRDLDKAIKKMGGLGNSYGEFKDGGTVKQMKDGGLMEAIDKVKAQEMSSGGEPVPAKFKGFSKLPEKVQVKMNPDLATKFEFGGDVKGKKGRMMCRGMGIARKNKGFKIT